MDQKLSSRWPVYSHKFTCLKNSMSLIFALTSQARYVGISCEDGIWMRLMHRAWQITWKNGLRPHKDISTADRFTGPLFICPRQIQIQIQIQRQIQIQKHGWKGFGHIKTSHQLTDWVGSLAPFLSVQDKAKYQYKYKYNYKDKNMHQHHFLAD